HQSHLTLRRLCRILRRDTLFPYTTLFRSRRRETSMKSNFEQFNLEPYLLEAIAELNFKEPTQIQTEVITEIQSKRDIIAQSKTRSEEHTSELQSRFDLVCRLLLEKQKQS